MGFRRFAGWGVLLVGVVGFTVLFWRSRPHERSIEGIHPLSEEEALLLLGDVDPPGWLARVGVEGESRWEVALDSAPSERGLHDSSVLVSSEHAAVLLQEPSLSPRAGPHQLSVYALETGALAWTRTFEPEVTQLRASSFALDDAFIVRARLEGGGTRTQVLDASSQVSLAELRSLWPPRFQAVWEEQLVFQEQGWGTLSLEDGEIRTVPNPIGADACLQGNVLWWMDGLELWQRELDQSTASASPLLGAIEPLDVLTCAQRDGDLVFLGLELYSRRYSLWRIESDTAAVVYQCLLPDGLSYVPLSKASPQLDPWRGQLNRFVPLLSQGERLGAEAIALVDVDLGELVWMSSGSSALQILQLGSLYLLDDAHGGLMTLDGSTGSPLAAIRSSLVEVGYDDVVGERLWSFHRSKLEEPELPWVVLDLRSLQRVAGGHPHLPHLEPALEDTMARWGIPEAR